MASVAGVNGIYVLVDDKGNIFRIDGSQGNKALAATIKGKAPFSVACSVGADYESCVVVDAEGHCWRGGARSNGAAFMPVG
jgi:hypothetical protein